MAVLSVAGVVSTRGAPKKLGSSPDITHALRELLTSAYIVAEIQNMCNEKQIRLRISIFSITQHKKCEYRQNNSAISVIALFHPTCYRRKYHEYISAYTVRFKDGKIR